MLQYLSGVQGAPKQKKTYKNYKKMNIKENNGIYYPGSMGKISLKNVVNKVTSTVKDAGKSVADAGKGLVSNIQNIKLDAKTIAHNVAKVELFIPRAAFLLVVRAGELTEKTPLHFNLAKRIAETWNKKGPEVKDFWYKVGGEPSELMNIINMASNKKVSGINYLGEPVTIGASVATATPLIAKIMEIIGKASDFAENNPKLVAQGQKLLQGAIDNAKKSNPEQAQQFDELQTSIKNAIPKETQEQIEIVGKTIPSNQITNLANQTSSEIKTVKENEATSTGTNKMLLYGVGAVAVVGAILLLKKK